MLIPFGVFSAGAGGGGAAGSYDLISSTILTGSQASITFDTTGLGSTYKHLQIRLTARTSDPAAVDALLMRFNSDTGTNYNDHALFGNGSTVASAATSNGSFVPLGLVAAANANSGLFGAVVTDILDFASTSKFKTVRSLSGVLSTVFVQLRSAAWRNTSAITSIQIYPNLGANLLTGTRVSLYGIKG